MTGKIEEADEDVERKMSQRQDALFIPDAGPAFDPCHCCLLDAEILRSLAPRRSPFDYTADLRIHRDGNAGWVS